MPVNALYTTRATATGDGRSGRTRTDDGRVDHQLAIQKELGGSGDGTNPEQLFAAGYAACFHSAIRAVAREHKLDAGESTVTAEVGIGPVEGEAGFGLTASLLVSLPGIPADRRRDVLEAAHRLCPYSRAMRGNVDVRLELVEGAAE